MFDFLRRAVSSVSSMFGDSSSPAPAPAVAPVPAAPPPGMVAVDGAGGVTAPVAARRPDVGAGEAPSPERVAAATDQVFSAMDQWGTDETAILSALRGRTPSEIAAIRADYEARHGTSLDSALTDELSGEDLQTAQYFLNGGPRSASAGTGTAAAPADGASAPVSSTGPPGTLTATRAPVPGDAAATDAAAASAPSTVAAPPAPPAVDRAAMDRAAGDIFRAVDGMGTDEDAIHRALRGKSAAEIAALREIYRDHYGRELDGDLEDELSDEDWDAARAALTADPVDSAVSSLINASSGMGTDEEGIQATLRGITDPEVRARVASEYESRTGQTLNAMLADEMGDSDLEVSTLLASGNIADADAAALDAAMHETTLGIDFGTDEDRINAVLERVPEADRATVLASYQTRTGSSLATDLREEMDGPEGDISIALAAGDRNAAAAARMANAADGWGTDEDTIFRQLEGRPESERQAIIAAFNSRYSGELGNFDAMVTDELGTMDAERARQLRDNGQLDPVFALRYAQDGVGTDEEMLRSALRGRSASEIAEIQQRYSDAYGIDLSEEMGGELSGRDEHYIMQMMRGEPTTIAERMSRAGENWEFERGEGAGLFGGFTDCFYDAGNMLDRQHDRLEGLQARLDGAASAEERASIEAEINHVLGYQSQDVEAYHAAQDAVANNSAMAAALVAAAAVTIASGGVGGAAVAPLISSLAGTLGMTTGAVTAALAAAAGGAATMATKTLVMGDAYGAEAAGTDAAMTLAQMATGGVLAGATFAAGPGGVSQFGQMMAARGINPTGVAGMMLEQSAQGAIAMGISGTTQAVLDENVWRGPGNGAARFASIMGTSFLQNAGAGIGTSGFNMATSNPSTFLGAMGHGIVGGSMGGVLQTAVDPNAWNGRWEDVAGRFGVNMAQNGINAGLLSAWQMHGAGGANPAAADGSTTGLVDPAAGTTVHPDSSTPPVVADPATAHPPVAGDPATVVPPVVDALPPVAGDPATAVPPVVDALPPGPEVNQVANQSPEALPNLVDNPDAVRPVADNPELGPIVAVAPELTQALAKHPDSPAAEALANAARDADTAHPRPETEVRPSVDTTPPVVDGPAPITPDNVFDLAKGAKNDPNFGETISGRVAELRAAQDGIKVGVDPVLQTQRGDFERAVALSPEATARVTPALDNMCGKVTDFINGMFDTPEAQAKALASLGMSESSNYSGAVGTDPAAIRAVLESGNVRERSIVLAQFQDMVAKMLDVNNPAMMDRMEAVFGGRQIDPNDPNAARMFGAGDMERLRALALAAPDTGGPMKGKQLFGPNMDRDAEFRGFKAQDMDTKLPSLPADEVARLRGETLAPDAPAMVPGAEASPLARSQETIGQLEARGIILSDAEKRAIAITNGADPTNPVWTPDMPTNWNQGFVANILRPDAPFISGARDASMPLSAGISGTTHRFGEVAWMLGADADVARLAAMQQLIPIGAHTFHEIASAAQGFQGGDTRYDPSAPYSPGGMGLPPDVLARIAAEMGLSLDDLNQMPQPPAPEVNQSTP